MESSAAANIAKLRATFENREAICIEKGAIRVRVFNIHGSEEEHCVYADVEEILTPGLGVGMFDPGETSPREPRRWKVTAGCWTSFNEQEWTMGYGGWTFYIGAELGRGVCEMAAHFPEELSSYHRYCQIMDFIQGLPGIVYAKTTKVFPDAEEYLQSQHRARRCPTLGGSQPPEEIEPVSATETMDAPAPIRPRIRVGLVRHFPVQEAWPSGWVTSAELQQWRERYDQSEAIVGPIDVSVHAWQRCFSSDLKRAYATAQAAYAGTTIQTPLLREVETLPFATGRLRLPLWVWRWVFRLAWLTGHKSQRAARDDLHRRVREMADLLEAEPVDTLVVSHAGMMIFLRKELIRRGFRGPKFSLAENGRLYAFERTTKQP